MSNTNVITGSTESVDLAALLLALDFELVRANRVEAKNVDGGK